jgi:hypothetical protein
LTIIYYKSTQFRVNKLGRVKKIQHSKTKNRKTLTASDTNKDAKASSLAFEMIGSTYSQLKTGSSGALSSYDIFSCS